MWYVKYNPKQRRKEFKKSEGVRLIRKSEDKTKDINTFWEDGNRGGVVK